MPGAASLSLHDFETAPVAKGRPQGLPQAAALGKPGFLEFFAGSGLVIQALAPYFTLLWANDICPKKAAVFCSNLEREKFHRGSINAVDGRGLPTATL
jgi:DNA (cytosine-5)-methyltransferase 1